MKALLINASNFFRSNPKAILPIETSVFVYLYHLTKGRLRYIFGLIQRLMNELFVGDLTDRMTLELAKPMIMKLARDRIARNHLNQGEEMILKALVELERANTTMLENKTKKSKQYISPILVRLVKEKLATVQKMGRNRYYIPVLDASIAYSSAK